MMSLNLFNQLFSSEKNTNLSALSADMHSHLIPGIDDGCATMEESMKLISYLKSIGIKKCITTPHIMPEFFPNTTDVILKGLEAVKRALPENNLDMIIEAAAEYYIEDAFMERIKRNETFLTFNDNYWLFELPMSAKPKHAEAIIFEMKLNGYKPILAHPERYPYLFDNKMQEYSRLRDSEILFQVNIMSFAGAYGDMPKKIAKQLAAHNMIDFVGTDLHNEKQIMFLKEALKDKHLQKLLTSEKLLNSQLTA